MKTTLTAKLALTLAGLCLVTGSSMAATILWQGGTGNFSDANWTVDTVEDQNHPSFGAADNNNVVHNTTINVGTVNGFNNSLVGAIGGDDSLLITGGAAIFGDFLNASQNHANDITLANGSMTFSNLNSFRSTNSPFQGLINFTGAAGSVFVAQTDNSGTAVQTLAGRLSASSGTTSFFSLDGTMVTTGGIAYDGTNLAAINTALATTVSGGRYFQITESGGTQTLELVAIPEPSAALLGGLGLLALLRRRR